MHNKLPLNLIDLLKQRTVEGERIEYKRAGMQIQSCGQSVPLLTTLKSWWRLCSNRSELR